MLAKYAGDLEKATSVDSLWAGAVDVFKSLGFDHAIYLSVDSDFENLFVRTTMKNLYAQTPPREDPFLIHACERYEILKIGAEFVASHPYVSDADRAFIENAGTQGLRAGIGLPMRLKGAPRFGGFVMGNGMDRATFLERMMPHAEDIRMFCMIIHRRIEELAIDTRLPEASRPRHALVPVALPADFDVLAPREAEVLLLLSQGKTRKQTAYICGLSVHTVSDYAKSGYKKLGVRNRAQVASLLLAQQAPQDSAGG